jgi:TPR repeat protein
MMVGMAALSACALQTSGMAGEADMQYRAGLGALVGDPPDYGKALTHFREGAVRDHAAAQRQLGRMYASLSPPPDLVRGYLWLFLASRSDPEARVELDYLTGLMFPQQVDAARALALGFVPGRAPDELPGAERTATPTEAPAVARTATPAAVPTEAPSGAPAETPTATPATVPTAAPTAVPAEVQPFKAESEEERRGGLRPG